MHVYVPNLRFRQRDFCVLVMRFMRRNAAPLSVIVLVHFSSRVYTVEYLDRKQSEKEIVIWV